MTTQRRRSYETGHKPKCKHDDDSLDKIVGEITSLLRKLKFATRIKPIEPGTEHFSIQINIAKILFVTGGTNMTTNYENKGQAGAFGHKARSDNNTFVQSAPKDIDLGQLAKELALVRAGLKARAAEDDPDADAEIGAVAQAEKAAKEGNSSKVMQFLKTTGNLTLEVAKSVAANLVKDVIEGKFGSGPPGSGSI